MWVSLHELISKLISHINHLVNINVSLRILSVLINNGDNGLRSLLWISDLQESVLMAFFVLTNGTEVEIFANAALVSNSYNWSYTAAITLNSLVNNLFFLVCET